MVDSVRYPNVLFGEVVISHHHGRHPGDRGIQRLSSSLRKRFTYRPEPRCGRPPLAT